MSPKSDFDKLLEKCTSPLLLDPDWECIMLICDLIRQGDIKTAYVFSGLKKKIANDNPHVATFALQVLESTVKNCGSPIHAELATREFMEFLKNQSVNRPEPVRNKVAELIQVWAHAFRNESKYRVVVDTFNMMKHEGVKFPTLVESDAMFSSETAPEWRDGDNCYRCKDAFTMINRKHHCRACGQIFCGRCSAKASTIPKFGIEREVRVCDACFEDIRRDDGQRRQPASADDEGLPREYLESSLYKESQAPPQSSGKSADELEEEFQLQLAMALSESEAQTKKQQQSSSSRPAAVTEVKESNTSPYDTSDMDPELARYLNRSVWEQKQSEIAKQNTRRSPSPSAPRVELESNNTPAQKQAESVQNGAMENVESERFIVDLKQQIQMFVNRMRSNQHRNRSIATDPTVQTLFLQISQMHPKLLELMAAKEEERSHMEALQDKLVQIRDARDALEALREEQRERRRREAAEQERQRQIVMMQKLDLLRQKKQEMLDAQRQQMLMRLQMQQQEMAQRREQQKHMAQFSRYHQDVNAFPEAFHRADMQQQYSTQMNNIAGQSLPTVPGHIHPQPQGIQSMPSQIHPPPGSMPAIPHGSGVSQILPGQGLIPQGMAQTHGSVIQGQGVGQSASMGVGQGIPQGVQQPQSFSQGYNQPTTTHPSQENVVYEQAGYEQQYQPVPQQQYSHADLQSQQMPAPNMQGGPASSMPSGPQQTMQGGSQTQNSFYMQGLANSLPQQMPSQQDTSQQPYAQQDQYQVQQGQQLVGQGYQQEQQQQDVGQLISFD